MYATAHISDRDINGDGLLQGDQPSLLNSAVLIEGFFEEVHLWKKKWLLCYSYNPHKNQISNNLETGGNIDASLSNNDNLILLGDFND